MANLAAMRVMLLFLFAFAMGNAHAANFDVELPSPIIREVAYEITLVNLPQAIDSIEVNGTMLPLTHREGKSSFEYRFLHEDQLRIKAFGEVKSVAINSIPLWLSIIPPLLAIVLALVFREVLSSLFIGIAFGSILIAVYGEGALGFLSGFVRIIDTYIISALLDTGHLSIIVFSMLIGALVALVSKNGGMKGVVNILAKYARTARSGQFATYLLGLAIFFDDYANTLVVGNTMRPVSDKLGISREKLSYIVDSTAAPVAAIAFITTWIGAELSYLSVGIENIPEMQGVESAYGIFLGSLQYAFYPILTLIFIFFIIYLKRDYGPMWRAEMKARAEHASLEERPIAQLEAEDADTSARWYNAVVPISSLILVAMLGLVLTGLSQSEFSGAESLLERIAIIIGNADSYRALLWASMSGLLIALLMTVSQRLLDLESAIKAIVNGFESLLPAILILVLAWSLAILTENLHTANFLSSLMKGNVPPFMFPAICFLLAALVSFSTGSSWGTMAILYPLMLGTAWSLGSEYGLEYAENLAIFKNVAACILAGSVLGDHCSPISDTTILSSLATGTNHIQHVRTQMPYALSVGFVAVVFGTLPAAAGISPLLLFPLSIGMLFLVVRFLGKKL